MVKDLAKESLIAGKSEQIEIRKEIKKQNERLKRLEDNFLDGNIDGQNYSKLGMKVEMEPRKLGGRESEITSANDDFNKKLIEGAGTVLNMKNLYESADITGKVQIVGSIFPRNFIFEENKVRTGEMNEVVRWIINNNKAFGRIKKGQPADKNQLSRVVTLPGFEPRS